MSAKKLTWETFSSTCLDKADMFEDPVYSTYVSKEVFVEMYEPLLRSLDGRDLSSYVDFFFEPSRINTSIFVFVDEDAKLDFRDEAMEVDLIPKLKEVMEGETQHDKKKRDDLVAREGRRGRERRACNIVRKQRRGVALGQRSVLKQRQVQRSMDILLKRLGEETDPMVRSKINDKLQKVLRHVSEHISLPE